MTSVDYKVFNDVGTCAVGGDAELDALVVPSVGAIVESGLSDAFHAGSGCYVIQTIKKAAASRNSRLSRIMRL